MIDVIETKFTPLLIHNNSDGEDTKILRQFREPAWNYQVIRFIDNKGKDIIPRQDKIWTMNKLLPRIEQTLIAKKKKIPNSLELLKLETDTKKHNTIALAMHCFWTGEMKLGRIDGVIKTEAGWYRNREVTLVTYHKDHIDLNTLLKIAAKVKCANNVYLKTAKEKELAESGTKLKAGILDMKGYRPAKLSDQKRQLKGSKYTALRLTPIQATKINAHARTSPEKVKHYLTARQMKQLAK